MKLFDRETPVNPATGTSDTSKHHVLILDHDGHLLTTPLVRKLWEARARRLVQVLGWTDDELEELNRQTSPVTLGFAISEIMRCKYAWEVEAKFKHYFKDSGYHNPKTHAEMVEFVVCFIKRFGKSKKQFLWPLIKSLFLSNFEEKMAHKFLGVILLVLIKDKTYSQTISDFYKGILEKCLGKALLAKAELSQDEQKSYFISENLDYLKYLCDQIEEDCQKVIVMSGSNRLCIMSDLVNSEHANFNLSVFHAIQWVAEWFESKLEPRGISVVHDRVTITDYVNDLHKTIALILRENIKLSEEQQKRIVYFLKSSQQEYHQQYLGQLTQPDSESETDFDFIMQLRTLDTTVPFIFKPGFIYDLAIRDLAENPTLTAANSPISPQSVFDGSKLTMLMFSLWHVNGCYFGQNTVVFGDDCLDIIGLLSLFCREVVGAVPEGIELQFVLRAYVKTGNSYRPEFQEYRIDKSSDDIFFSHQESGRRFEINFSPIKGSGQPHKNCAAIVREIAEIYTKTVKDSYIMDFSVIDSLGQLHTHLVKRFTAPVATSSDNDDEQLSASSPEI